MNFRNRLDVQNYEQRLQLLRWERAAETKRVERLSAILVKKASSVTVKTTPARTYPDTYSFAARSIRS